MVRTMEHYQHPEHTRDGCLVFSYDVAKQHEIEMRRMIREILEQEPVRDFDTWADALSRDLSQFTD